MSDCFSNYFIIAVLIVFFMLLYVYAIPVQRNTAIGKQTFIQKSNENYQDNELVPLDKVVFVAGNGVPDKQEGKIQFDQSDPAAQSVDGTENTPRSIFPFAFNKCDIKCCGDSGGLSCNGGCVCLTKEQKRFMSNRGYNNKINKCSYDEY